MGMTIAQIAQASNRTEEEIREVLWKEFKE